MVIGLLAGACSEACPEKSADKVPAWMTLAPRERGTILAVGRAEGKTQIGSVADARKDASRSLVSRFYGEKLQKNYTRIRSELETQIIDKLSSQSEGVVAGARDREIYWEHCSADGGMLYRAGVLVEADRQQMDDAVAKWITSSPQMVKAAATEREAQTVVKQMEAQARAGLEATSLTTLAAHLGMVGKLRTQLSAALKEYQESVGAALPVDRTTALKLADELRDKAVNAAARVQIGVTINAESAGASQSQKLQGLFGKWLASLGLAAHSGATTCQVGWTHRLEVAVAAPVCKAMGMGLSCELPIRLTLGSCPDGATLKDDEIVGEMTRGASTQGEAAAVQRAWANLGSMHKDKLVARLGELLAQHIPVVR